MSILNKKNNIVLFIILAIIVTLGACLGGRGSAPRDTIEISKEIKKTEKKQSDAMLKEVLTQDTSIVYKAINKTFDDLDKSKKNGRRKTIFYTYNTIIKQYDTVAIISTLYKKHQNLRGAIVSSRQGKDRKSLIIAYVNPSEEGVEVKIGTFSKYNVISPNEKSILENIKQNAIEIEQNTNK